jgi:hypothetical protein
MNGKKRDLFNPFSYNSSGARFEVDTIYSSRKQDQHMLCRRAESRGAYHASVSPNRSEQAPQNHRIGNIGDLELVQT